MVYVYSKNIPKNTTEKAAIKEELDIVRGIIHRVEIVFPRGCANLARVQIFYAGTQIYPSKTGQFFMGDDETIAFNDFLRITTHPLKLVIKTWNLDEIFDHEIQVRIGILKEEEINPYVLLKQFIDLISTILGI